MTPLPTFRYGGARALVAMHDEEVRRFIEVWREASAAGLTLPPTDDPSYANLDTLLHHVLRAARGYMTWMCEVLGLPDPKIEPTPPAATIAERCDDYVDHVLARWRSPLIGITEEESQRPEFKSRWGVLYCVDAMLEHAVMHPKRHRYQLRQLLANAQA